MPIYAQQKAVTNTDPNDEMRLHESLSALWPKLLFVEIHRRAGRTGRWSDTGWSFERLTPEEVDDPSMPEDTVDDMVSKLFAWMRDDREKNGPHVYQLRPFVKDRNGEAKHETGHDISVGMMDTTGQSDVSPRDRVLEARAEREAVSLVELHKMYLESTRANLELVKAVTASPLVQGQVEVRRAELEHEVAMFDKKAEREDDQEIWDIGKTLMYAKFGIGSGPSANDAADPESCDWAQRLSTLMGNKARKFAVVVDPENADELEAVVKAACTAKTKQDFQRHFDEVRKRWESHSEAEVKKIVGVLAKELGPMQLLEFRELVEEVLGDGA